LVLVYLRLRHSFDLPGWTSLMVIVLFLGGIQLVTIGIVGEYIARIYEEVKFRPLYLVARRVGVPDEADATAPRPGERAAARGNRTALRSFPRGDTGTGRSPGA